MMADVVDKATRSRMMAGIKGANTRPEMALRKALHALGLRFRLHAKRLPGRPAYCPASLESRDLCSWLLLAPT